MIHELFYYCFYSNDLVKITFNFSMEYCEIVFLPSIYYKYYNELGIQYIKAFIIQNGICESLEKISPSQFS